MLKIAKYLVFLMYQVPGTWGSGILASILPGSIASTGLERAYDSLKTEKQFKEKRRKKKDRKKKEENWRKKFRAISRLEKIEEI